MMTVSLEMQRANAAAAAQALQQQYLAQQQHQQQFILAQMKHQQEQQSKAAALAATKKQREIYVGNLTVGLVTMQMLKDLFNGALSAMDAQSAINPPVVNLALDPSGKFCFVEFRTEELANLALHLDKVDLCGRQIKVRKKMLQHLYHLYFLCEQPKHTFAGLPILPHIWILCESTTAEAYTYHTSTAEAYTCRTPVILPLRRRTLVVLPL
jgi:hypothetical protein